MSNNSNDNVSQLKRQGSSLSLHIDINLANSHSSLESPNDKIMIITQQKSVTCPGKIYIGHESYITKGGTSDIINDQLQTDDIG